MNEEHSIDGLGHIPTDWSIAPLSEFVEYVTYGFTNPMPDSDIGPFKLTAKDVSGGRIVYETARRTTWEAYNELLTRKSRPAKGDVLLTKDGSIGRVAVVDRDDTCINQSVAVMRPNATTDARFLAYLLQSPYYQGRIAADSDGSTIKHIYITRVDKMSVAVPSPDEQRAIAAVLGSLDDKIEQNRRTARALDELANATFKAWFVDFEPVKAKADGAIDFPGMPADDFAALPAGLVDSSLGPVPEAWSVASLPQLATFLNGLALQKYPSRGDGSDLPVIKIAELRKGSSKGAEAANDDVPAQFVVNDGDLLFSWSGTLEVRRWFGGKGALNQHLFKVTPNQHPLWFTHQAVLRHLPEFRAIASSKATTMGHIQRRHLDAAKVVVPTASVLRTADAVIGPLYELSGTLQIQNRSLAALRDYLLPKLLTGDVRVRPPMSSDGN